MDADSPINLYRLKVGEQVYEAISPGVIVKNIRSGKLKRSHLVAHSDSDHWVALGEVPELEPFFGAVTAPKPGAELYDVQRGDEVESALPRAKLIEMIRNGELVERQRVRRSPDGEWTMAGDLRELQHYFDLRRQRVSKLGVGSIRPEDTGTPFYLDIAAPFVYMANLRFLFNLLAILAFFAIAVFVPLPIVSGPITILTNLYLYTYFFRVVSHAGNGGKKFPDFTESSDLVGEMMRPAIQFFLTRLVSVLPLIIYIALVKFGQFDVWLMIPVIQILLTIPYAILFFPDFASGAFYFMDPVIWVLLAVMLLYVPIALMRQASYGEFLPTFNVPAIFLSISRAFGSYVALIAFMLAVDIIGGCILLVVVLWYGLAAVLSQAAGAMAAFSAPVEMLLYGIMIIGTFLKMYFIGRFLFQNAERMGWD